MVILKKITVTGLRFIFVLVMYKDGYKILAVFYSKSLLCIGLGCLVGGFIDFGWV